MQQEDVQTIAVARTGGGDVGIGAAPSPSAEPVGGVSSRLGILRHKHFRTIVIAAFGSDVGGWLEFVGIQWIVAQKTGSTFWLSFLALAQLGPMLFLGLLGGVVSDRVNRRTLLLVTQAIMMAIALALAAVVWRGVATPHVLLVLAFAQGVTLAFNAPAWQVLLPRLVPREDLTAAITFRGITFNMARVVGPALGGVLMSWLGPAALFGINAASFVGVLIAVWTTPDAPAPARGGGRGERGDAEGGVGGGGVGRMWSETREGLSFVFRRRGPRAAFLATAAFAVLATPVLRFLPLFVSHVYHMQEKTFGVLTGVMGVGAVCGGLLMKRVPAWYPKHHFIPLSVALGGASILIFSLITDPRLAMGVMFFVGVFWMWAFNSAMSAMQMLVDDAMRGRVMAVVNTASLGLMPVGSFVASIAGEGAAAAVGRAWPALAHDGLSTQLGVGSVAAVLAIVGTVMLIWRTPEIDGLGPGDAGYDRSPGLWQGLTAGAHRPG